MRVLFLIIPLMAISCKKDQVISFEDDFNCNPCGGDTYCTPVEQGDNTPVQFDLTAYEADNLITNGTFASSTGWTIGADWTIGSGKGNAVGDGSPTALSRSLEDTMTPGYYYIEFELSSAGTNIELDVLLGGVNVGVFTGQQGGTYTVKIFKFIAEADITDNLIAFFVTVGTFSIDNVVIKKMSSIAFEIKDCETDTVYYTQTDHSDIEYFESGNFAFDEDTDTDYFDDYAGVATITLDWDTYGLTDGCYCLCIKDFAETTDSLVTNGDFASASGWDITNSGGGGWAISAGKAQHTDAVGAGTDVISQTLASPLLGDCSYNLTFDMESSNTPESLTVLYDTAVLTNQTLQVIPLDGNNSYSIPIDNIAVTKIKFRLPDFTDSAGVTLDNVAITKDIDCVECECVSECIAVRESHDHLGICNMLIEGECDEAAWGFRFDNPTYSFKGRVMGKIRSARYPEPESIQSKNSDALYSQVFAASEKSLELQIYQVPQRAHDWIRLALNCDTFEITINGVTKQFVKVPGDYIPDWRKSSPLAPVIVEIKEVQQLKPNTYS